MTKKLFDLMGEVLDVNPTLISDKTIQRDIEKWDSLNSLLLIDAIEKEYNIKFPIDDVMEISGVIDIKNILSKLGINVSEI